jgi:hypothetical protein
MLTRAGVSALLALAAVGGASSASFAATTTQTVMSLSSATGPTGGANTLTLTLPSTATTKFVNTLVGVQFQATTASGAATASCTTNPATSSQATANGTLRYISNTKVSIVVPDLTSLATSYVLVCAYNQAQATSVIPTTATVVAKANYLVSGTPTLRLTASGGAILPAKGPTVGSQVVTVYAASAGDFPTSITAATPLTATLGGQPLTNITPLSNQSFSAVTPARSAAGAVTLTVTTAGGTVTSTAANTGVTPYTYVNGISASPNTVPQGQSVDVDVTGSGFSALTFVAADTAGLSSGNGTAVGTNSTSAHVYLVNGVYNQALYAAGVNKTNGQVTECTVPVVISDTELICTINAAKKIDVTTSAGTYTWPGGASNVPNGTYTLTVVDGGSATAPTYQTALSSGATFTVSDF